MADVIGKVYRDKRGSDHYRGEVCQQLCLHLFMLLSVQPHPQVTLSLTYLISQRKQDYFILIVHKIQITLCISATVNLALEKYSISIFTTFVCLSKHLQHFVRRVIHWRPDATSGSFFARDNTANFLYWCRKIGVDEAYLFESEDLGKLTQKTKQDTCFCSLLLINMSLSTSN